MSSQHLPQIDSIQKLAEFWDTHDLTDFASELEEVGEPVVERKSTISVRLDADDAETVHKVASSKGLADSELVRQWIVECIHASP